MEMAVLGALMLEKRALDEVAHLLHKDVFYRPAHQTIYDAICKTRLGGDPVDSLTVVNQLRKMGDYEAVGGIPYISELTGRVASAANIEAHSWTLIGLHRRRVEIIAGLRFVESLYNQAEDLFETEDQLDKDLLAVRCLTDSNHCKNLAEITMEGMATLQGMANGTVDKGAANPFRRMQDNLPYFQPGDVTVIGADTSVGKSAFVQNILMGVGSGILFSFEMKSFELWKRALAMGTFINSKRFNAPERLELKEWDSMVAAAETEYLLNESIFICDDASYTVERIQSECRKLFRKKHYPVVIIDYLQIVAKSFQNKNENDNLQHTSGQLKKIAMELNTHFFVLSQFIKRIDPTKFPTQNDFRGCGQIAQDANNSILLHRVNDDYDKWMTATTNVSQLPRFHSTDEEARFDKIIALLVKARGSDRFLQYPFYFHGATNQFFDPDQLTPALFYQLENGKSSGGNDLHLLTENLSPQNFDPYEGSAPNPPLDF